MKDIILSNGIKIPMIGLGVWKLYDNTEMAVKYALENGYTHIDTAMIYENEESVGKAISESSVKREDIFLTTKLWNEDTRSANVENAFNDSLKKLGTDYIDLYLIHWPTEGFCNAWLVLEKLYKEGKIKSIGVSNFHKHHLDELYKVATIKPMVNQIESHPNLTNKELIDYCQKEGIQVEAWSPLGGTEKGAGLLESTVIENIGKRHKKSNAQIIIRWNVQRSVIVLPKSKTKSRITDNINVFDFTLTDEEMNTINGLNKDVRFGPDPDNFDF